MAKTNFKRGRTRASESEKEKEKALSIAKIKKDTIRIIKVVFGQQPVHEEHLRLATVPFLAN